MDNCFCNCQQGSSFAGIYHVCWQPRHLIQYDSASLGALDSTRLAHFQDSDMLHQYGQLSALQRSSVLRCRNPPGDEHQGVPRLPTSCRGPPLSLHLWFWRSALFINNSSKRAELTSRRSADCSHGERKASEAVDAAGFRRTPAATGLVKREPQR